MWDLGARRIFSALRLKILMPGAKHRRQALRSHTPALSHPGEGVNRLANAFALSSEKIDSLIPRERVFPRRKNLFPFRD